ncbi:hypothetical protein F4054_16690 [Candidatus Poribacteria bacterium]|nr:hypothetical protein [Candidatus Poribacteria bacterium]MYG05976.1 hypothetical protein [Candidatus Poribacteria bacterium]MYK23880.1 hypothetical protein [Candidatus Poribacteria bacterium]
MNFYQKILLFTIVLLACWIRVQGVDRLPDGQFTSNDAYLFAGQAQEIAEQGSLPARDMRRWLPHGRDNGQIFPLYAYAIAYTHKSIGWMSSKLTLYHIQVYIGTICFILGLGVLCFFLARTYGVVFATITALLLATLPGSIERSAAGFGDRDAWCWMLGILAVISYLWKERLEPGQRRWIATALAGFTVFLGGLSWEGFGFFVLMIVAVELYKFCSTDTEQHLKEYLLWILMFVPWLYLMSPAYRSGYGFSTHVAVLMLLPPLTVFALRGGRYLLLKHAEQLRPHPRKLAWGLTLLSIAAGVGYIFMQSGTFAETAYPFRESQLMQGIGELGDPNFRYWAGRYGAVFVLGSLGLIAASLHLWKWKSLPLVISLVLFVGTTFFRTQVNGWIGADTCNTLFFVSLGLTVLSFAVACFRREETENEWVTLATLAWFLLWVGISRGGKRHDFFLGLPLAYGTAWLLYFSPVHLIQKLKDVKILYPYVWEKRATAIFAVIMLIPVLFWTPIGGHATKSVYAAARMRPPVPGQNSRSEVFKWIHDTLPKESVIAANWDYGTQLNVLGGVNTVVDSDHFLPHWIHLYYRHVFSAQDASEALGFLKTHKATHLMLTERGVLSRSGNYSSMGSDENADRQFELYQLTRTETPIGTPYRMQPRGRGTPLDFIEIARTSPDTLSITAQFKDENEAVAEGELGETLMREGLLQRTVNTPTSQISVDIENGGLVLDFDSDIRLSSTYYIPPLGWNSLAVKLFLRGEHNDIFIPVYPIDEDSTKDIKVWEIRYPPDTETDEKYLATEPAAADKK